MKVIEKSFFPISLLRHRGTHLVVLPLVLSGILTGCSTLSWTYNYADWLLYWKVDQYFDVTSSQKPLLQTHLTQLHSWHRNKEVPRYVAFLQTINDYWDNGLTPQEVDNIFQQYQDLRGRLGSRLASESAEFLVTVNSSQIQNFEQVIQEENSDLLNEIGKDPDTRKVRRVESVLEWLEEWVGGFSSMQEQHIRHLIEQFPDTTEPWLQYRKQRQREFITLLESPVDHSYVEHQIREWLTVPEKGAPPIYIEAAQQREQALKRTILTIDRMLSSQQRKYTSQRLSNLIQELDALGSG